jgi:hypothetical protein
MDKEKNAQGKNCGIAKSPRYIVLRAKFLK